jgi:hypothetical protein
MQADMAFETILRHPAPSCAILRRPAQDAVWLRQTSSYYNAAVCAGMQADMAFETIVRHRAPSCAILRRTQPGFVKNTP